MKTVLVFLCVGVSLMTHPLPADAGSIPLDFGRPTISPDSVDTEMDVRRLNAEAVFYYRNAVLARHCKELSGSHARQTFWDYQENRCGMHTKYRYYGPGQKPPARAPETDLTPQEVAFLDRLDQREREIHSGQIHADGAGARFDLDAISNRSQFAALPDSAWDRLAANGFVVLPGRREQLFHLYEENDYRMIPSFITADAVLQLYHIYFDCTLRRLEEHHLLPACQDLCRQMRELMVEQARSAAGTPREQALHRAALYFAVAEVLSSTDLEGLAQAALPAGIERKAEGDFRAQLTLISAASGKAQGPIFSMVDYTMFRVRGHYLRNASLSRYFRVMMWLGLPGFPLSGPSPMTDDALAIAHMLTADPGLLTLYDTVYEPTRFYVGPSDDVTPLLVRVVADSICGPRAPLAQWTEKSEQIRIALGQRNPARIRTRHLDDRDAVQMRFMGMRYIPDSAIIQSLLSSAMPEEPSELPEAAWLPSGLDFFGVLGVPVALEVLRDLKGSNSAFWDELEVLRLDVGELRLAPESDNLFWRWLHALKTLNQPSPRGAATCMQTQAWGAKNLSTALGSWAELRHDTILYSKQFGAECGDGSEAPHYVGYVEARPDFFGELLELQRYTTTELASRGITDDGLIEIGRQIEELLAFLERVSRSEVDGQPLSESDYTTLRLMGANLESLTILLLVDDTVRWYEIEGTDRCVAVVADIGSVGDSALEVGVGLADELYALVEIEGALVMTRGAVFSYYEFWQPTSHRLTDEEWQKMLESGKAPPRPRWISRFFLDQPSGELPVIYMYSTGC